MGAIAAFSAIDAAAFDPAVIAKHCHFGSDNVFRHASVENNSRGVHHNKGVCDKDVRRIQFESLMGAHNELADPDLGKACRGAAQ